MIFITPNHTNFYNLKSRRTLFWFILSSVFCSMTKKWSLEFHWKLYNKIYLSLNFTLYFSGPNRQPSWRDESEAPNRFSRFVELCDPAGRPDDGEYEIGARPLQSHRPRRHGRVLRRCRGERQSGLEGLNLFIFLLFWLRVPYFGLHSVVLTLRVRSCKVNWNS